jgi:hypothetical protein
VTITSKVETSDKLGVVWCLSCLRYGDGHAGWKPVQEESGNKHDDVLRWAGVVIVVSAI